MRIAQLRSSMSALRLALSVPLGVIEELIHLRPRRALDVALQYRGHKTTMSKLLSAPGVRDSCATKRGEPFTWRRNGGKLSRAPRQRPGGSRKGARRDAGASWAVAGFAELQGQLALRDGSSVEEVILVSVSFGGAGTLWVFANGSDVFVPFTTYPTSGAVHATARQGDPGGLGGAAPERERAVPRLRPAPISASPSDDWE